MNHPRHKYWRHILTATLSVAFPALVFFINVNSHAVHAASASNTIVFDRYDSDVQKTKVFVMNADGSNVTELAIGFLPTWSGDGQKIAYSFGNSETYDIWTMNADGSGKAQLTQNYRSFAPAWSPDNSKIAFVSDHEGDYHVYVVDADGQNQHRLNITASEVVREYAPTWSPDGTKVIFLAQKVVNGLGRNDYYEANADGSGTTKQLTTLNALLDQVRPAVSPDGSRLVFEVQHDLQAALTDGSGQLINLSNTGLGNSQEADYAPGGSKIIFRRGDYLTVMNANGSNPVSLDVAGENPDWNPTAVLEQPTPTPTPTPIPAIEANLAIQANASNSSVTVGGQVTYTINVSNSGPNDATGVAVTGNFPTALSTTLMNSSQGSCGVVGGQLNCQLGTMAASGTASITIVANTTTAGYIGMQLGVAAIETDPDTGNNSATAGVSVVGPCAQPLTTTYEITRTQWRRYDNLGQDELILTVRNRADHAIDPRFIVVFDNLPAGITVDPSVVAGYTQCAPPIGSPYVVGFAPNKQEWKPMQTISVRILFNNPARGGIPFTWRYYTGSVNP